MLLFTLPLTQSNRQKLESFYYKYSKLMKYIAYKLLNDNQLAEDAVCDAFIKIINHIDKIDDVESNKSKAFAVITVKSTAIDIIRRRKKYRFTDKDAVGFDGALDELSYIELKQVISSLAEPYSETLILKACYSFSDDEIAKFHNITASAVRKRLERARKMLDKLINEKE